jgi:hypothetical protein
MAAQPAAALDRLCDPRSKIATPHCSTSSIAKHKASTSVNAIVARWKAGVPVRVLVDTRANSNALNASVLQGFRGAGIPMRRRIASGILPENRVEDCGGEDADGADLKVYDRELKGQRDC